MRGLTSAGALVVGVSLLLAGCRGAVAGAALNTAIAATYSGVRRAGGDCYSPCLPGTRCNPATGYCDPLPCRGECQQWERCDESGLLPRCVPSSEAPFNVSEQAEQSR
ncbi:MAG: hypothetical protein ACOX6T_02440 [Myxococcales bacterium]|jgi:hypothetical protein